MKRRTRGDSRVHRRPPQPGTRESDQSAAFLHNSRNYRRFGALDFAASRPLISAARNLAMRPINPTGTGSESGNRMVPFSTSYAASESPNAAITESVAAYIE